MGTFSIWHWVILLLVVVLIFGTKKLRGLGIDLGQAIHGFKQGLQCDIPTEGSSPSANHANTPKSQDHKNLHIG